MCSELVSDVGRVKVV